MIVTSPTAAELAARAAFAAAFNAEMPPAVALDMVQDETGDRDDAFRELMSAAGDHLAERVPIVPALVVPVIEDIDLTDEFRIIASYIRGFSWQMVKTHLGILQSRHEELHFAVIARLQYLGFDEPPDPLRDYCVAARAWDMRARRVIALCRDIEEVV